MINTKDVTIYDVAEALNLSQSTVSRGLKDHPHIHKEIKKKILAAAKEIGEFAATALIEKVDQNTR